MSFSDGAIQIMMTSALRVFQNVQLAKQRRNVSATQNSLCHPRKTRKIKSCRNSNVTTPLLWIRCRDQRAVCFAPRAARRPVPLSTTPVPLRKSARSSRATLSCATHERRASVGSLASSLRLRGFTHFVPPASPSASRRQTPDRSRVVKTDAAQTEQVSEVWTGF